MILILLNCPETQYFSLTHLQQVWMCQTYFLSIVNTQCWHNFYPMFIQMLFPINDRNCSLWFLVPPEQHTVPALHLRFTQIWWPMYHFRRWMILLFPVKEVIMGKEMLGRTGWAGKLLSETCSSKEKMYSIQVKTGKDLWFMMS